METTAREKYEIIKEMTKRDNNLLNISWLCDIAGVSRSGYYHWLNAGDPYKTNIFGLMVMEDQVKRERDEYGSKINYVNKKLMQITDPVPAFLIQQWTS